MSETSRWTLNERVGERVRVFGLLITSVLTYKKYE